MRLAVVGHVEWFDFVVTDRLPAPGEIVMARDAVAAPGGGGAMAAYAMRSLTGACSFWTAAGDDPGARATLAGLRARGLDVHAAVRPGTSQVRAIAWLTPDGERTITVLGQPPAPRGDDVLPWADLCTYDAVLVVTGDAAILRAARSARLLVATPRARTGLLEARVPLDALVGSSLDPLEPIDDALLAATRPHHLVQTASSSGGTWQTFAPPAIEPAPGAESPAPAERDASAPPSGPGAATSIPATRRAPAHAPLASGAWSAAPLPGPVVDAYGCGDAFAAALTAALAAGRPIGEACELGAAAGAAVLCERAPEVGDLSTLW